MSHLAFVSRKGAKAALIALYIGALIFFYYKYVPIVWPFQFVIIPILIAVAGLTWRSTATGTLAFIFFFPLVNNLPYFFRIFEPIPHAPAALVLFLFYFLGFLLSGRSLIGEPPLDAGLLHALRLFIIVIAASALIGFFRFANFWPFLSDQIYELTTNRFGVRSGGAIMSIVFCVLNYASAVVFFLAVRNLLRTRDFLRRAVVALGAGSLLALAWGIFQLFGHLALGNNPTSIQLRLINGTFKDALSFGTYLSMAGPLFAGVFLAFKERWLRVIAALVVIGSVLMIFFTGSKSGLGGLVIALTAFLIAGLIAQVNKFAEQQEGRRGRFLRGRVMIALGLVIFVLVAVVFVVRTGGRAGLSKTPMLQRLSNTKNMLTWRMESQWKPALQMTADYPLTGVGIGSFIIEVANYSNLYQTQPKAEAQVDGYRIVPESAENYVLQIASELGLIGIFIWGWIALLLLRQILNGLKAVRTSAWKYLYWGALCALISFAFNAQTHTYIGSYEIKYAVWLFVGLIYTLPGISREAERERAIESGRHAVGRWKRILEPTVLIVFCGLHLWNSTHSLSLAARTKTFNLDRSFGLGRVEKTRDGREFRWIADAAGIPVKIDKPVLVVPIHASHPDIAARPVTVRFQLVKDFFKTKKVLKEILLTDQMWKEIEIPLETEIGNDAVLLITVSRTWNPLKTTGVPDPRDLGIAVGEIK